MLVTVLHRLDGADASGTNSFTDVLNGKWYTNAIAWASANGIVEGLSGNRFAPNAPIAREQLAAILFRYAKACGYEVSSCAPCPSAKYLRQAEQYQYSMLPT